MQLALFRTPPPERRRTSASGRVGGPSVSKRGLEVRLQRRADAPEIKSAAGLSFLKPAPSLEKEGRGEVEAKAVRLDRRVAEPIDVERDEVVRELDIGAGEGRSAELAPHPTRGKLLPPEVLTEVEIRALIGACSTRGITGHRNRALLAILWRTGVRISEALELQAVGQGVPLLCTLKGTPTDPSYARHLLTRLDKRAGLERRVHPHGLRHTHAADLALAGVPVLAIQQQLGHRSLVTTANYLCKVGVRLDLARMIRPST